MSNIFETPINKVNEYKKNNIFIKRDDLLPISFGGNKARKAELFFKDLKNKKCDCVITYGSNSSNHCRIIANLASANNIKCYIVSPSSSNEITFNTDMFKIFDAEIVKTPVSKVAVAIEQTIQKAKDEGYNPYYVEGGGHGNLGTQAYVSAYDEILEFEKKNNIKFDYIFHASGTGTTQAGLVCGSLINGDNKKIIGISIARKNPRGKNIVIQSVNDYLESIERKDLLIKDLVFTDKYVVDGYATYNDDIINLIKNTLKKECFSLDTTYTGKAFWGMTKYIEENDIKNKNILFIHTGGTPLFFNDLEKLINK